MQIIILWIIAFMYVTALVLYSAPSIFNKINVWNDKLNKANEINGDKYYCDDKAIAFVKELFDGIKNVSIGAGFLVGVSVIKKLGFNGIVVGFLSVIGAILIYLPFFVWSLKIIKACDLRNNKRKLTPEIVIILVGSISVIFFLFYNVIHFLD